MAKKAKADAPAAPAILRKQLLALLQENWSAGASTYDVYSDWVALLALSLANSADLRGWEERESEYLRIAGHYSKEQMARFGRAFGLLVQLCTAEGFSDVLGWLFTDLELASKSGGQFFTPYDVCRLMAQFTLLPEEVAETMAGKGFVTVQEPACGAGATLIAAAEQLHALGYNPQEQMVAHATDIDLKAVHMTFVQLALLGIPAVVVHGDTLRQTVWSVWYTPFYILGGWERRLRAARRDDAPAVVESAQAVESAEAVEAVETPVVVDAPAAAVEVGQFGQLSLLPV